MNHKVPQVVYVKNKDDNLEFLIRYFILGFGCGLTNFAASNALNDYYVKDRVLAEGIFGSGVGVGLFAGTYVLQKLVDEYNWQVV